jgi:hypothetical protein
MRPVGSDPTPSQPADTFYLVEKFGQKGQFLKFKTEVIL